jgi:hypothetical protein
MASVGIIRKQRLFPPDPSLHWAAMDSSGSDTAEREALGTGEADALRGGETDEADAVRNDETGEGDAVARRAPEPDTDERTVWLDTSEGPAIVPGTDDYAEVDGDTYEREATERDTTSEWQIRPAAAIGTVAQLEERIDVALVTAQAAEEAALEIGTASLEAAEQARRAAALAERASVAAARAAGDASDAAASAERSREAASSTAAVMERSEAARGAYGGAQASAAAEPAVNRPDAAAFLPRPDAGPAPRRPDPFEERFNAFRQRAERVMVRLQKLEAGADPGDGPSEVVRLR